MPLYLVRWNDLSVALVRAKDVKDLFWKVDQFGNPYEVSYWEYRGPLFLHLEFDADWEAKFEGGNFFPVDLELKEGQDTREFPNFRVKPNYAEEAVEMTLKITEVAFPSLFKLFDTTLEKETPPTGEALRTAMLEDMQRIAEPTFDDTQNWYE